jgi:membrane protease YdiL (CAAX protease family)
MKHYWWRGQLFLFDAQPPAPLAASQRLRLAAIFLTLEFLFRPFLRNTAKYLHFQDAVWSRLLQMALLVIVACLLMTLFARVPLRQFGLYRWRFWTSIEKIYCFQILSLTVVIFAFMQFSTLRFLWTRHVAGQMGIVLLQQMLWGFYQELLYRGIVQSELVHRLGAVWGILIGNLIFTFGPLHFYHFALSRHDHAHLWTFAGIFAIGLYFAVLYHRSRNLWIVATLHGVGDFFIDGLAQIIHTLR